MYVPRFVRGARGGVEAGGEGGGGRGRRKKKKNDGFREEELGVAEDEAEGDTGGEGIVEEKRRSRNSPSSSSPEMQNFPVLSFVCCATFLPLFFLLF